MSRQGFVWCLFWTMVAARPVPAQNTPSLDSANTVAGTPDGAAVYSLRISTGDLLNVNVFDTPELSGKLRVDDKGNVTLPLGDVVCVTGMTAEEAGRAIELHFRSKDILKDPHVSVTILEYATQGVTVLGEVKNPGVYPLLGARRLLDLLSAAGGVTSTAGRTVTITHRIDSEHPVIVKVDSKSNSTAAFNVDVRPGDTIMVSHAGIIYVVGDVGKPGGFLLENSDQLTVLQAVALAQGINRTAALDNSKLIRKTGAERQELPVPLKKILSNKAPDQMLADGDILFVPSSAAKGALRDMESIFPSVAGAAIFRVP